MYMYGKGQIELIFKSITAISEMIEIFKFYDMFSGLWEFLVSADFLVFLNFLIFFDAKI